MAPDSTLGREQASAINALVSTLSNSSCFCRINGSERLLIIPEDTLQQYAAVNALSKLFEVLLFLRVDDGPEVLRRPKQVFKGLKRPLHGVSKNLVTGVPDWYGDDRVLAVVACPDIEFALQDGHLVRKSARPVGVFVVYVLPFEEATYRRRLQAMFGFPHPIYGRVCGWEWVGPDPNAHDVPDDWRVRYQEELSV